MPVSSRTNRITQSGSNLAITRGLASEVGDDDYERRLNPVIFDIFESDRLADTLAWTIEPQLRSLFRAERISLYERSRKHHELVESNGAVAAGGRHFVPLGPGSVVGYVAMTKEPVLIVDVRDAEELRKIHPHLRFDPSPDRIRRTRTRTLCVVPLVSKGVLLGVLEVANREVGGAFGLHDLGRIQAVGRFIAQKLRYDFRATGSPFEYLLRTHRVGADDLKRLQRGGRSVVDVARALVKEIGLSTQLVGSSLERYYQVPFLDFDPELSPPEGLSKGLRLGAMRGRGIVPLAADSGRILVLTDDPNDTRRIMEFQQALHLQHYALRVGLRDHIDRYLHAVVGN